MKTMEAPPLLAYESHLPVKMLPFRRTLIVSAGLFGTRHLALAVVLCVALPCSTPVVAGLFYAAWRYFRGVFDLLHGRKGVIPRLKKTALLFAVITGVPFAAVPLLLAITEREKLRGEMAFEWPRTSLVTFYVLGFVYFAVIEALWATFLTYVERRIRQGVLGGPSRG
jgi:hypothetical protein